MGLVDSHCHLDDTKFYLDRAQIINRLKDDGVDFVITCADSIESSKKILLLADKYSNVFASAGVHPHNAKEYNEESSKKIISYINHKKVVAIGEIGLDYHYDFSPRDVQLDVMLKQIKIAEKYNMPIIFHIREAYDDFMSILKKGDIPQNSVLHCFSGSCKTADECLDNNMLVSFTGVITFKNAKKILDVVKRVPLSKMMI